MFRLRHAPRPVAPLTSPPPILQPGRNCWRFTEAGKLAFLIDGCEYFNALAATLARAQQRIFILGWDFDAGMRLQPDRPGSPRLGDMLRALVEERPALEVYILIWRGSLMFGENSEAPLFGVGDWAAHERIHMRLDGDIPLAACHHQKIVCVDDSTAFLGGMDLTERRWDDRCHHTENGHRLCDDTAYEPVHDVQVMFAGAAAHDAATIALERWRRCAGEELPDLPVTGDSWPPEVTPALTGQRVALARTSPLYNRNDEVREIEKLIPDALAAARQSIYIETQYFASAEISALLEARLGEQDCPEIVVLATRRSHGLIEHYAMAEERDYLFTRLRAADRRGRLRLYYPVTPGDPNCDVKLHSKLLIVDDRFLRIGSSNLNRRSMGVDTECDLAFEADTAAGRTAISGLRTELLAEHVGCEARYLARRQRRSGSLIAALDRLTARTRRPGTYLVDAAERDTRSHPLGRDIMDPASPLSLGAIWASLTN